MNNMNKNQWKVALTLVAVASTAAAQSSSVTIFGVADVGIARLTGVGVSRTGMSTGGANISRLGLRGEEDLGAGLKAGFWFEAGLDVPTGAGKGPAGSFAFNRRATVSLSSPAGELRLGRDDAATFLNTLIFDPFLTNGVGGTMAFVMRPGAPIIQRSSAVSYFLPPNLGGFYGQIQYAFGDQSSPTATRRQDNYTGLRFGYRKGRLNTALGIGKLNGATSETDIRLHNFGLSYDFSVVRPMLLWATEKQNATRVSVVQIGFTAPLGQGHLRAQYSRFNTSGSNVDWSKVGIGYGYDLSKRTQLYGTVAHVSNKTGSQKSIGVQGLPAPGTSLGGGSSGYEIGIRHNF